MKESTRTFLVLMIIVGLAIYNSHRKKETTDTLAHQLANQPIATNWLSDMGAPPVVMPTYSPAMENQVPANLMVIRAQPAVYRVLIYGNIDLRVPDRISVNTNLLLSEWTKDNILLPTQEQRTRFFWSKITQDPEKYLSVSAETSTRQQENILMASGTGFLVSRDGIVITNAHVVSDMDPEPVPDDPQVMLSLLGPEVQLWMNSLAVPVGAAAAKDQEQALATSLLLWLRQHTRITGTFTEAKLAINLATKPLSTAQLMNVNINEFLNPTKVPIVAPLKVLAKGTPMPGKDIAILQVSRGDWDPIDRAICLPLGDSDEVFTGTRVQAIGFPGASFNPALMQPEAEYRCTVQDGQISGTRAMSGGWNAFQMSADINHGDSGGPVLDSRGRVIAINVGSATGASGHTLAVPINYAREMLRDLHVQVDSGPATALWIEALADYNEQHYADANTKLNLLREIQAQVRDTNGRSMPLQSTLVIYSEKVNPYIDEMINRVLEKLHPTRTAMN